MGLSSLISRIRGTKTPTPTPQPEIATPHLAIGQHRAEAIPPGPGAPPGQRVEAQIAALRPETGTLSPEVAHHALEPKPPSADANAPGVPTHKPLPPTPTRKGPVSTARPDLTRPPHKPLPLPPMWQRQKKQVEKEGAQGLTDESLEGVGALMGYGDLKRGTAAIANLSRPETAYTRWIPGSPTDRSSGEQKYKRGLGGSANRVDVIDYAQPLSDSGSSKGFFKPALQPNAQGAYAIAGDTGFTGIDETKEPHMAARAVASSRLDQALGLNVLAREQHAGHGKEAGNLSAAVPGRETVSNLYEFNSERSPSAPLAPSMEKAADGKRFSLSRQRYNKFDLHKPGIQKGLNDLQWMDAISAQADRHGGNIFIDDSTEQGSVHGIDNDLAWGTRGLDKGADYDPTEQGVFNVGLPNQIDQGTASSILGMKAKNLEKILNAKEREDGRKLTPDEIKAAKIRLTAIQEHIKQMKKSGGVVKEWNEATYGKAMEQVDRSGHRPAPGNYLARTELQYQDAKKEGRMYGEMGNFAEE